MITLAQMAELYEIEKGDRITIETSSGKVLSKALVCSVFKHDGEFIIEDKSEGIIHVKGYKKIKKHRD